MDTRFFYVNGDFLPESEAKISVLDRGFLFADGVYEVTAVLDGQLVDNYYHLERLARSLRELRIELPILPERIESLQKEVVARNGLREGIVYVQITRGTAERNFLWPADIKPSVIMFSQQMKLISNPLAKEGAAVVTVPDIRWQRRDIKTISLLAQALAKDEARFQGAQDAWMVEDEHITEGTSTNAFIVTADGKIKTRALGNDILHGITRRSILRLARREQIEILEQAFTVKETRDAAEAFATGSSFFVLPVVQIDGYKIGDGKPGPITTMLRKIYIEEAKK